MRARPGLVDDKVALVTGAGSGIGRATAMVFAREGASGVMVVDVDKDGAEETAALIRDEGYVAETFVADVSRPGDVDGMVQATVDRFGRLDCAHNNAGLAGPPKPLDEYSDDDADPVIRVNVYGTFYCMRAELRVMVAAGRGAIVNTASATARLAVPGHALYSGTKAAVCLMTAGAAREYAETGVRINAVLPGAVGTDRGKAHAVRTYGSEDAATLDYPLRRLADPLEVGEAVVWLCSDRASYIIGESLFVDGGQYSSHQRRPDAEVIKQRFPGVPFDAP
jgi:NAD(P)-dependent dehydrogenase (short-subunit alcohol dehydrogenase family)